MTSNVFIYRTSTTQERVESDLPCAGVNTVCVNMKAYGMDRWKAGDTDACGCADNGRATRIYKFSKASAYHTLRGGKKAAVRRHLKWAARREGKLACLLDAFDAANCP
jgi:hypothetical protein